MSITELGRQEAQAILTSKTTDSNDGYESPKHFYLEQYPTTAIGGTAKHLRRCSDDRTDGEYLGLELADPYVCTADPELEGTAMFSHTEENEFSLVNIEDDEIESLDRAVLRPDNTAFRANPVETFGEAEEFDSDTDRVVVRLTGKEGRYVGFCLDQYHFQNTSIDRDSTEIPEFSRSQDLFDGVTLGSIGTNTLLRRELRGEELILLLQRTVDVLDGYNGDSYWLTVLMRKSGADEDFEVVTPNIEEPVREEYNQELSPQQW